MDRTKYIASGLVAFDLRTRIVKWSTHLDLSTDSTTYRAYAYSAPTLVDIDRDGKLEVIAGTSVVSRCLCFAWQLGCAIELRCFCTCIMQYSGHTSCTAISGEVSSCASAYSCPPLHRASCTCWTARGSHERGGPSRWARSRWLS